jgi:uncharacterized protein (TIGR02453 family)
MANKLRIPEPFRGFTEATNDFLIGIKFNNNKEWFHENKELYQENVHKPMVALGDEVYELMNSMDSSFNEKPKISRINRDIRFSNNKQPYKVSKWFFLRGDGRPDIQYNRPTYFFEINSDWWRYGMFFYPKPVLMERYRKKICANTAEFEAIVTKLQRSKLFDITGEQYKRDFKLDVSDKLKTWTQMKYIDFIRYEDYTNMTVYSDELPKLVFNGFKKLYPMYKFLDEVNE